MSSAPSPSLAFADRTALVTGATSGIGLETALLLALGGACVILHGPTAESTALAAGQLTAAGVPEQRLEQAVADFAHLGSELADRHERLDLLVNNAGRIAPERRTLTEQGNELCFQVNYLAPYLLTRLLERPLARSADSRIVAVGSSLHRTAKIDWTDLTRAKRYSHVVAYGQSKLALTTFIGALSQWLPAGHTAITVHPGVAETAVRPLYGTSGRPAAEAAGTLLTLCRPQTEVVNGAYYDQLTVSAPGPHNGARRGMSAKLKTLLAIVGPGLIVMVGDNDAGAFATYGQAGQNYGTHLLWTLLLLVPVLYVNQEMVLRLGAVTGVGHARLILERFGKFWGAFSVIDLFLLNALTLVTEFIGITLATGYLGLPRVASVVLAAAVVIASAFTGSFRRFERIAMALCAGSLLLVPVYFMIHPRASQMAGAFVVPGLPGGAGQLSTVMLLIIGIVGTTVAPWQLFFQQSYVIDKRITPRFMRYEKADLVIGIGVVLVGAAAVMGIATAAFAGTSGFGNFTDTAGIAHGVAAHAGKLAGVLFAIALLDASIIGAFAVSLSTAYAIGDVFGMKHSLHRGVGGAKGFYAVYAGLVALAATVVLIPGSPLGVLTVGVQTLAGVLLPSASVFLLLLLCNDKQVLGPWVNGPRTNAFTAAVVGVLVTLSVILTASVLFPHITAGAILDIMAACGVAGVLAAGYAFTRRRTGTKDDPIDRTGRDTWRMPPLETLTRPAMATGRRIGMSALRTYLFIAMVLVVIKLVQVALGH